MGEIFLTGAVVLGLIILIGSIIGSYDEWKNGIVGYKPDWLKEQEKNESQKKKTKK